MIETYCIDIKCVALEEERDLEQEVQPRRDVRVKSSNNGVERPPKLG